MSEGKRARTAKLRLARERKKMDVGASEGRQEVYETKRVPATRRKRPSSDPGRTDIIPSSYTPDELLKIARAQRRYQARVKRQRIPLPVPLPNPGIPPPPPPPYFFPLTVPSPAPLIIPADYSRRRRIGTINFYGMNCPVLQGPRGGKYIISGKTKKYLTCSQPPYGR